MSVEQHTLSGILPGVNSFYVSLLVPGVDRFLDWSREGSLRERHFAAGMEFVRGFTRELAGGVDFRYCVE